MGAEDAGKGFFAVKGDPCELAAVIIEKTGRKADPSAGGYIGERCVVVGAVEVPDLTGTDQPVLDRLQGRRGSSAYHQRASVEICLLNEIFLSERIVFVRNQVDAAFKQTMYRDAGDLPGLFFQCKKDVSFVFQERLYAVFVLKQGGDLHIRIRFAEKPYGLRKKTDCLPDHQTDGDIILVFCTEILALLDGALEVFAHACKEGNKLCSGRGQRCPLPAPLKDCKADFLLQQPDLIGEGRLADK